MRYFLISLVCILAIPAHAALVVDNGTNTTSTGGWCTSCGISPSGNYQVFDDFTLSSNVVLRSLVFEGTTSEPSDITISIWSAPNSGLIHSQTYEFSELSPIQNTFSSFYENYTLTAILPNWSLSAGTYWISMYSNALAIPEDNIINGSQLIDLNTNEAHSLTSDTPFRLYSNVVPIPAAVWLFGSALAGLGWMRRKSAA